MAGGAATTPEKACGAPSLIHRLTRPQLFAQVVKKAQKTSNRIKYFWSC
jgi:hypothetical protein